MWIKAFENKAIMIWNDERQFFFFQKNNNNNNNNNNNKLLSFTTHFETKK